MPERLAMQTDQSAEDAPPPRWVQSPPAAQHLQTFLAVVDAGGRFTDAAKQIGMSQPGITHQVNELERRLGVKLFDRARGRAARLTRPGRTVEKYARGIVRLHSSLLEDLDEQRRHLGGHLRIGSSPGPGEHWLPPLLCSFAEQHEQVSVELHIADARSVVELVFANELELGFVGGRWSRSGLDFIPLAVDELVFIGAPGHRLARRKRLTLADLAGERFIAQEAGSGQRITLEQELQERDVRLRDLELVAELGNQESVKAAVLAGHGLGCVWRGSVQAELALGTLVVLEVGDFHPDNSYYAVRRTHRRLSRVGESFLHEVRLVAEAVR